MEQNKFLNTENLSMKANINLKSAKIDDLQKVIEQLKLKMEG